MNFARPLLLWALPLAATPFLLHLLARRAARRIRFSDLTLLRAAEARRRPRARLRELLLALARCAALAALVVAAAGPVRPGASAATGEGLDLVLLLDASYSTRAREAGRIRFDAAREAGRRLLRRLAPGDRVAAAVFDDAPRGALVWGDARAAEGVLSRARPGLRGTDAGAALAAARELLAGSPAGRRRAVVVLGDGTARMLPAAPPVLPEGTAFLGLSFPPLANAWLTAAAPSPDSGARAPRLELRASAAGGAYAGSVEAWVGGRRAPGAPLSVPAGGRGRAVASLPAAADAARPSWAGRAALRADALPEDDELHFSFRHRPAPRVLVLHADPQFFRAGRPGWFLRELLGAARETLVGREADFLESGRWEEADFSRYGAIILPDAGRLPPGLGAALERFVARGGGAWIMPGPRAAAADLAALSSWLPARLGAAEPAPRPQGVIIPSSPELGDWSGYDLARVAVARRFALEPASGARVWARGASGEPLLVSAPHGRGRAAVGAFPFDAEWTSLPLKPSFPAWTRAALTLTLPPGARDDAPRGLVGAPLSREWGPDEAAPDRVVVRLPDGRRTRLEVRGRRAVLPEAVLPGLYEFEEPDGRITTVAADFDRSLNEGDLTPISAPPWRAAAPEDLEQAFLDEVHGRELRDWALAALAVALLAEAFLSLPAKAVALLALLLLGGGVAHAQQGDRFVWTQLKVGPDWDPYPGAPDEVVARLAEITSARVAPQRRVLTPRDPALFSSPFLYLAGIAAPEPLSDEELRRLRQFVSGGGFLWIEDASGGPPGKFDGWTRELVGRLLPEAELKPLPPEHAVFRSYFLLRGASGRARAQAPLEGALWGGRAAILYFRGDALGAWAKDALGRPLKACVPGGEPQREQAKRLTLNAALYALTGSYKSDAVHQAAILEKLKGAAP